MNIQCKEVRKIIIEEGYHSGRGHISSALSLVEIFHAIYTCEFVDIEKIKKHCDDRDRVILSKGHGALGLYATLAINGIISRETICGFATSKGLLSTHPVKDSVLGIEMTAGSLGQGIGYAGGISLSNRLAERKNKTIAIVGDGELQEGSNWEALLFIAQHRFDSFTLIVDRNSLQISGNVESIVALESLIEKFTSFNFDVQSVDGHNVEDLKIALGKRVDRPKVIIANTVKGKGISFIENKDGWHGKGLTKEQYDIAISELEKQ